METVASKKYSFLMVLCILTFVGSGYGVIGGVIGLFTAKNTEKQMAKMDQDINQVLNNSDIKPDDKKVVEFAKDFTKGMTKGLTKENQQKQNIGNIVASIFCLLGAFLMWRLSKKGFYLYLLGTIIGIAVPLVVYGMSNLLGMIFVIVSALIGILFVILYSVNYSKLEKS
jgi:hypothetical protein